MTRFVVDCGVVLHLAGEEIELQAKHELVAPTLLRSQTLSALHQAVADAFGTPDAELARRLEGVVATATIDALRQA